MSLTLLPRHSCRWEEITKLTEDGDHAWAQACHDHRRMKDGEQRRFEYTLRRDGQAGWKPASITELTGPGPTLRV